MIAITRWLESAFNHIPLSLLEVWGRFGYLVGMVLAIAAFGGFTFRPGARWGLGRARQEWDAKALLSGALTFVLIFVTGYVGSSIVLVPGAQTFESLKDLSVFICILLFGYPALIAVPVAYGLSDLIEGVPPGFLADWWVGYFINPACFWIAYQFIGKSPDFRLAKTWGWYLLFVAIFMIVEPPLWGYICSGKFTSEISYRNITPALFFTTGVTWIIAPFAMLGALPLAKRYGIFWADIAGHVRERLLGRTEWIWESGTDATPRDTGSDTHGLPVRVFLAAPVIALVLIMVGAVAYLTVRSGEVAANSLASRLHQEVSDNINLKLDVYLEKAGDVDEARRSRAIDSLLSATEIADHGRAFIIDRDGRLVASSDNNHENIDAARPLSANASGDAVVQNATSHLLQLIGNLHSLQAPRQFTFDIVSAKPLARETWLAQATPYHDNSGGIDWVEVTAIPPKYYLSGVLAGNSRAAMVFAVALIFSLLLAVLLAGVLTDPIRRISRSTQAMAAGDLAQRVPAAGLLELSVLARSFNHMAAQLQESFSRTTASEIELRAHRDHLEELVDARTTALVAALDQAEAANHAKSAFLASMSHELRTPLNAVLGFAHLMAREPGRDQRDTAQLEKIQRAGEHLLDLINDVLSLSRIEANRLSLNLTAFDPRQLIDGIQEMTRVRSAAKNLAFEVEVDAALAPVVEGDEGKLRQVLLNLLGNAVKFTQEGGVELNVISLGGERVRFEVSDSGPGIADDEIPTLFDAFVQTETGRRTGEGSGLGLHLSQGLVRLMGGEIQVTSEAGRGSRFSFEIPLASAERRPDSLPRQRLSLAAVQPVLRQLVADDKADNRELLTTYLESAGFTVRAVTNGQDAVDVWLDWRPDIVWMDMRMPILDGYQATRRIRELERELGLPHTTILAITASVFDHDRDAVFAAGCDDALRKPFKSHELFDMLAQHKGVLFEESQPVPAAIESPRTEDLEALPGDWCNDFAECLSTGNVAQARRLVDRLPDGASRLAVYLRLCLKEFRMDELDRLFSAHRPL